VTHAVDEHSRGSRGSKRRNLGNLAQQGTNHKPREGKDGSALWSVLITDCNPPRGRRSVADLRRSFAKVLIFSPAGCERYSAAKEYSQARPVDVLPGKATGNKQTSYMPSFYITTRDGKRNGSARFSRVSRYTFKAFPTGILICRLSFAETEMPRRDFSRTKKWEVRSKGSHVTTRDVSLPPIVCLWNITRKKFLQIESRIITRLRRFRWFLFRFQKLKQ